MARVLIRDIKKHGQSTAHQAHHIGGSYSIAAEAIFKQTCIALCTVDCPIENVNNDLRF